MSLTTISGEIQAQPLNDNFSYLDTTKMTSIVYNVKDSAYGAIGDGVTDDTTAIQAAINDVQDDGGIVYFPPGDYKITSELLISLSVGSGGIILEGAGQNASVLVPTTLTQNCIHIKSYEPVAIRDLAIYSSVTKTAGAGIYVEGPISDATKANLNSNFENLNISNQYDGFYFTEAAYWKIDHCRIGEAINYGVYIENSVNVDEGDSQIVNSLIVQKDSNSINAVYYKSSGGLKFVCSKINGFKKGLNLQVPDGAVTAVLVISGSSIENCTEHGLYLTRNGTTGTFDYITITGNEFFNSDFNIEIPTASIRKGVICGNIFGIKSVAGVAIQCTDTTGLSISGNSFIGNGSALSAVSLGGVADVILDKSNKFTNITTLIFNASTTSSIVEIYSTSTPANGTWRAGDRIINLTPSEAGGAGNKYVIWGWVCSVSGAPGTWLEMRCLTGN